MSLKHMIHIGVTVLLLCAMLLSFTACDDEDFYDPIKSGKEDREVILEFGEEEVNRELFRFLFMSRIDEYDGGDRNRWTGDEAAALWETAKADVINEICEIYGVFEACRKWGLDPYGENIDTEINRGIKLDIDGGTMSDGTIVTGYGSVDAYKAALAESHCTDAVRRLLYRYKACLELLDSYIITYGADGKVTVTDELLSAFLVSDSCTHVNRVFVSFESYLYNREQARTRAENLRRRLVAANGNYDKMVTEVFSQDLSSVNGDPVGGVWFGRLSTSERDYPTYYQTLFSISPGEISEVIEEWDGYYIVYGMDRSADLSNAATKNMLTSLYLEELYWGDIRAAAAALKVEMVETKHFTEMTPASLMEGK